MDGLRTLPTHPCPTCHRPYTVQDVARRAGVSVQTVRRYLRGDLLRGDSPMDRYSRQVDKVETAIADFDR